MTLDELLEIPRAQLTKEVFKAASDKERRMAFVDCVCELKRLRSSRSGGAARLPQPGPFQPRFQAAGDDGMASIKIPLPAPPDPATLDPGDRPVKRKVTATVGGAVVFEQVVEDLAQAELSLPITQGPADAQVDIGQAFADADDNWSDPTVASVTVPAAPVVVPEKDTKPPAPPAAFTPTFVTDAKV